MMSKFACRLIVLNRITCKVLDPQPPPTHTQADGVYKLRFPIDMVFNFLIRLKISHLTPLDDKMAVIKKIPLHLMELHIQREKLMTNTKQQWQNPMNS